ncbi:hypothetical protein [Streptomyces sp. FxanaA7]|uniref:putative phage holin n=1 Tax=Streptomyces sp. FxanaA7 TaxID=1265492 RepID=UPI00069877C1|nr:hypothetical protein [Streptomyces sp. FxanaA7]
MRDLSSDQWMNVAMSLLAVLLCTAFIVIYHLKAPWWRSKIGRNQVAFAATVAALCLYTALATFLQDDPAALMALRIFRTVVLLSVAALMVQRIHLLLKAQQSHHDRTGV